MPKVSKESSTHVEDHGIVEARSSELDGYAVDFVTFRQAVDHAPLLKGLPDDRCPCPHWGYVLKGRMTYHFADHDEVIEAGEAFYVPGGHSPEVDAGTEIVQFSPAEELRPVSETIVANVQRMMQQQQAPA